MKMVAAVAFVLSLGLVAFPQAYAGEGCEDDPENLGQNFDTMGVVYDADEDEIHVTLKMCGEEPGNAKIRLRVSTGEQSEESNEPDEMTIDDVCYGKNHYQLGTMYLGSQERFVGPSEGSKDDETYTFEIPLIAIDESLEPGRLLLLWADVQDKGIKDRYPGVNADNEVCGKNVFPYIIGDDPDPPLATCNCFAESDIDFMDSIIDSGPINWAATGFLDGDFVIVDFAADGCALYNYPKFPWSEEGEFEACQKLFEEVLNSP